MLLDKAASSLNAQFEEQVKSRNALLNKWHWLAPAAMVHEQMSKITQTDRESHLEFVREVYAHHERLRALYYDRIFEGKVFSMKDLERLSSTL